MRVAIVVDALALAPGAPPDVAGVLETAAAVEDALRELGHAVARCTHADVMGVETDVVFNLCESVAGDGAGEARVIGALELRGVPVTGASAELVMLARRKDHVAAILGAEGIAVPRAAQASFPCIVKPAAADGSVGITQASVARDAQELERALANAYGHGPVLVQELLTGIELNVAFVGDVVLPVAEICYQDVPAGVWPIVDYAAKWQPGSVEDVMTVPRCPAAIDASVRAAAVSLAQRAWDAVGGCGVGRVDLRADAEGVLHVLEVNPNPDLSPTAGLARMARAHGWSYGQLVERVLADALARLPRLRIEPLPRRCREDVRRILEQTDMFRTDEIEVALEVIDAYYDHPDQDYTALGAFSRSGELVGYSCHGPTPCTLGTWDLYWIAVSPSAQRMGVGSALLQEVERRLAERDARMLLIETSSQPRYAPTRAFYERHGYHEVARVPEFYAPGDDRVIFASRIHPVSRGIDAHGQVAGSAPPGHNHG